jgi:hypothetical protein
MAPGRGPAASNLRARAVIYANVHRNGTCSTISPIVWHDRVVHGLGDLPGLPRGPCWGRTLASGTGRSRVSSR